MEKKRNEIVDRLKKEVRNCGKNEWSVDMREIRDNKCLNKREEGKK